MHTGRLHGVLAVISDDFSESSIIDLLNGYINCMSQVTGQKIAARTKKTAPLILALHQILIFRILELCLCNKFTPTQQQIFRQIGAEDKIGKGLWNRINNEMESSYSKGRTHIAGLEQILSDIITFHHNVQAIIKSFNALSIELTFLPPEKSEVGISLPSQALRPSLEALEKETHQIAFLFRTFSELVTSEYIEVRIRTLSTSDIQLFMECTAAVAGALALAIERIVAMYKTSLEIKKLKRDLAKHDIPPEIIESIKTHVFKKVEAEVHKISAEIVNKYADKHDKGRLNELEKATKKALTYMAHRIEKGAVFEASVGKEEQNLNAKKNKVNSLIRGRTRKVSREFDFLDEVERLNEAGRSVGELPEMRVEFPMLTDCKPTSDEDVRNNDTCTDAE